MPILTAVHPLDKGALGAGRPPWNAAVADDERSIPSRCTDDSGCDMTPSTIGSPVLRRWGFHSLGQVLLEVCHD
jgi:hypothetical protein